MNTDDLDLDPDFPRQAEQSMNENPIVQTTYARPEPYHIKGWFKSNLRFLHDGMAEISLQIPYEYREQAAKLLSYIGVPLEIYMRPLSRNPRDG